MPYFVLLVFAFFFCLLAFAFFSTISSVDVGFLRIDRFGSGNGSRFRLRMFVEMALSAMLAMATGTSDFSLRNFFHAGSVAVIPQLMSTYGDFDVPCIHAGDTVIRRELLFVGEV